MKRFVHILNRVFLWAAVLFLIAAALFFFLRWRGWLLYWDEVNPDAWEVFGVDVSSYQGEVDWEVLKAQGVDFAFIKATEGSSMQDREFKRSWAGAAEAGVRVGAYHFFSYDSPGETQAANFISTVPKTEGALPPVVDIEFYGDKLENPPTREAARAILDPLLQALEDYYGQKPILYVTYRSYRLYIAGAYEDYPLWCSSPLAAPLNRDWTFWQYSHHAEMDGYRGTEQYIDLDVFRGTQEDFDAFGLAD